MGNSRRGGSRHNTGRGKTNLGPDGGDLVTRGVALSKGEMETIKMLGVKNFSAWLRELITKELAKIKNGGAEGTPKQLLNAAGRKVFKML